MTRPEFYQFDDGVMRPISQDQALNTESYVVFYEMTSSRYNLAVGPEGKFRTAKQLQAFLSEKKEKSGVILTSRTKRK